MGIGRFYRWLSERYPLINEKIVASSIPTFDNLYLDLNGILHNCSHGNSGGMLHANEDLMWQSVFAALDLVISTISPRKLLYLAADGVAPRAKMNQQRARRYRAAKSAKEAAEAQAKQQRTATNVFQVAAQGTEDQNSNQADTAAAKAFDSNCISPGTEFMASFFRHLRFYCEKKFQEDTRWRGLKVLLSGPDVPGEGEHKIMAYLRCCKAAGSADPNTRHCLYGLDADLIMLSLASHEPQFALLREEVVFGRPTTVDAEDRMLRKPEKLQLLHISLVREYLALDLLPAKIDYSQEQIEFMNRETTDRQTFSPGGGGKINETEGVSPPPPLEGLLNRHVDKMLCCPGERERAIDDFVIFCFLAGNDFLPHTFSTDIWEKGLDSMILCYGRFLAEYRVLAASVTSKTPADGPWLVGKCGQLNLLNLYIFLQLFVETVEDYKVAGQVADLQWLRSKKPGLLTTLGGFGGDSCRAYRALFYEEKLKIVLNTEKGSNELRHLCRTYLEGLQWVAYYYFRGPDASGWRWYYSYHYAPFMRDVLECDVFKPSFQDTQRMISTGKGAHAQRLDLSYLIERTISLPKGEPYSPFMQLLSILPPQSAALLPPQLRHLLTNPPPELQPFFPNDFEIDMQGVKVPWGGVTLLPFVDESVLERIALPLVEKLPPELLKRNETGRVVLLMREKNEHSWRQHGLLLIDKHSDTYKLGQLASIDPVYEQECFFFKNKIINRSLGVALDIPSLVNRINGSMQEGIPSGNGQHQVFVSSLPWAFPDVVDSCVVEEEVLVLPPLVADRLEAFKVLGVLRILNLKDQVLSPFSYSTARDAVASYVETLRSALQSTDFSSMGPRSGPPVKLQPLPKLHPKDDEFLFPTTPLPGASPAAAVLTPSLFSKCISWHRGTGVKVFKRISSSQSIVLSVMPFSREELHRGSACSIVSLLKPTETLNELLSSRFVLFDYPFVKLASPVAVWHPTFYLPLDFRSTAKCADIPSDPMEQLQEVETEKRRLRAQGIHVADETEAFHFFTQHTAKARTEKIAERQQNSASYWDPEEQVLCGSDKERNLGCAPVQSLEQQLQRLALDVTSALPGTEQQQLSRSYHPDTALSTLLVELRPVEDIVMAEKLVDLQSTSSSSGNPTSSKPFEKKPTACVHFRYGSETVFRLLPLLSTPSSALLESMQQCHQDVIDAVEAHRKVRWKAGDDVFCIASDRQQQLRPGLTGVLEKDPTSEDSHVLVRVSSWREEPLGFQADLDDACSAICAASSERAYTLEEAAELMGVTPFAAFQIFSSVFLKEGENMYDCGLHIAIFTKETGKPAYVVRFSLPWPNHGSRDLQQSQCRSHLFTSNAVELGKKIVRAFPALGNILDSVGGNGRSIMMNCHLKAADVFRGLPDPAFLASRLASMAAQSPSRRAKAVTKEYAWLPNSMYSALDAERGSRSAGLPDPRAVVLPANVANCVPAADLLTIQKHIVSKFLVLRKVQQGEDGECRFVYTVKAHLGQRVAYARFRGSVPQGAHGTACGFASKFGGCNIKCSYINDGAERTGATRSPNPQASRGAGSRPLPFARGGAYVDSAVIGLAIRRQLNFRGLSSEKHGQQHEAKIHGWKDAGLILSQISAAERVSLFQKQLAFLEDLCIEVLLDEPCLGASDGNGSIETLRILLCPASHWLPICSEPLLLQQHGKSATQKVLEAPNCAFLPKRTPEQRMQDRRQLIPHLSGCRRQPDVSHWPHPQQPSRHCPPDVPQQQRQRNVLSGVSHGRHEPFGGRGAHSSQNIVEGCFNAPFQHPQVSSQSLEQQQTWNSPEMPNQPRNSTHCTQMQQNRGLESKGKALLALLKAERPGTNP